MKATASGRPAAILRRAHDLDITYAQVARDLGLDVQLFYSDARLPAETLRRLEAYVVARETK